jgi:hypothetical protein
MVQGYHLYEKELSESSDERYCSFYQETSQLEKKTDFSLFFFLENRLK